MATNPPTGDGHRKGAVRNRSQTQTPSGHYVRAFRSLRQALDVLELLEQRGIEFRSLTDQIDTTTPMGKCMYQVRNAFAELERSLISERTKAGMAAARARGKHIGRPRSLSQADIQKARQALVLEPGATRKALAAEFGVSPQTLARALK